ncbi:hypothetical protein INS49_010605 [Diaporthe citri]|uniref:uncharacterized protein n=1 Tax=Diaporthe citri TaxID=83186 RepID=UPI001C814A99|nr:uncharacterized protein INS49_010605 [Diaporthe citri]KAG6362375.1 hypothetical protein INS49_010605 [Diaporthe citri]
MNKVKDPVESEAMGQPSHELVDPRRPSTEPLALVPRQPFYGLHNKDNYDESPENVDKDVLEETDYGDGTRGPTFSLAKTANPIYYHPTHQFTADLVVDILNLLLENGPALDQFPELSATGNLNLVLHDDGQAERVSDVPFKWQLLRRTDEDRREEAAAHGGGAEGSP